MKTFMLIFAYVCGCLVVGCTSVSSKDDTSGGTVANALKPKPVKRVTREDAPRRVQQKKETRRVKHQEKKAYDILSLERTMDDGFAYHFVLQIADGAETSLKTIKSVKQDFRKAIRDDYAESFFGASVASVFVEFPQFMFSDGKIVGKAVVMSMVVLSMKYDPLTRTGCISVCLNDGHFEEARKWIRHNIETLVRDKNIALTTGEIPYAAKFYLGREEVKDGNILEIEFKTE